MSNQIAAMILELTNNAGAGKTICPSEVARVLWPDDWRDHMEEVRQMARRLRDEGRIEISQKGRSSYRG